MQVPMMTRKFTATRGSYDIDLVKGAARGRWPEILAELCGWSRDVLDGQHHPCPSCGGTDRFRLVDADAGAVLCNSCFRTRNGDGIAAVQWSRGCKFGEALKLVAEYLGVERTAAARGSARGKASSDPAADLEFLPWQPTTAALWCTLHKPGILPAAMLACGCRLARYRGSSYVFALPIWGSQLAAAGPVGWCLYNATGGTLPTKQGPAKVKIAAGSKPGVIGPVDRLAAAREVWKTEGPTDLMAFHSLADLPADVIGITNAMGANETRSRAWIAPLLAGKIVRVVHDVGDENEAGQRGAVGWTDDRGFHPGWCQAIAEHVEECRNVVLPASMEGGKVDLRDWVSV